MFFVLQQHIFFNFSSWVANILLLLVWNFLSKKDFLAFDLDGDVVFGNISGGGVGGWKATP